APVIVAVAPRIGPRLDGAEAIAAVLVGEAAPVAVEIGIERGDIIVDDMAVAAPGIRLPDLDEDIGHRPAGLVHDAAVHDDALADGQPIARGAEDEIIVMGADDLVAEDRPGLLRQRLPDGNERHAGGAQDARLVVGKIGRRMDGPVPLEVVSAAHERLSSKPYDLPVSASVFFTTRIALLAAGTPA